MSENLGKLEQGALIEAYDSMQYRIFQNALPKKAPVPAEPALAVQAQQRINDYYEQDAVGGGMKELLTRN